MAKKKKPRPEDTSRVARDPAPEEPIDEVEETPAEAEELVAEDVEADEVQEAAEETPEEVAAEEHAEEVVAEDQAEEVAAEEEGQEVAAEEGGEEVAAEEEAVAEEPPPPLKPQVTTLTLVLCVLVLLASIGAFVMVVLDHGRRQEWSYGVYLHDLSLMGLPLEEEGNSTSASRENQAPVNLDPAAVKKAYQSRGGVKGVSEPFQGVHEVLAPRIRPQDIGPDTEKLLFPKEPVKTLEQEVARLKKRITGDIEEAAKEAGKDLKSDDARRKLAMAFVLPLARHPQQVETLEDKIQKAKGTELSALLERGVRLRLLAEILGPLEEHRPYKTKTNLLDQLSSFDNAKVVEDADALLLQRFEDAVAKTYEAELYGEDWAGKQRTSMDKREDIAFLLYTISQVKKPDGQLLYPDGPERTRVVVGLNEYIHAADSYALALSKLRDLVIAENDAALSYVFTDNNNQKTLPSFVQGYPEAISKIQDLQAKIANREFRLKEYRELLKQHEKQLADRQAQYNAVVTELIEARKKTKASTDDLNRLQQEFFAAQRRLADAAENNSRLLREIQRLERQK
jgi:hypothetical protein